MLDEELLKNTYKQLQLAMKGLPTSISNSSNGDLDFFLLKEKLQLWFKNYFSKFDMKMQKP